MLATSQEYASNNHSNGNDVSIGLPVHGNNANLKFVVDRNGDKSWRKSRSKPFEKVSLKKSFQVTELLKQLDI